MSNIKDFRDFIAERLKEEDNLVCIELAYFEADQLWDRAMKRRSLEDVDRLNRFKDEYFRARA